MTDALACEWRFYSNDMLVFAEKVLGYTDDFDRQLPLYFCIYAYHAPILDLATRRLNS
jgi:hypothetical protein